MVLTLLFFPVNIFFTAGGAIFELFPLFKKLVMTAVIADVAAAFWDWISNLPLLVFFHEKMIARRKTCFEM